MGYRFEFDSVNKILLLRVEGRFTDELLAQGQPVVRLPASISRRRRGRNSYMREFRQTSVRFTPGRLLFFVTAWLVVLLAYEGLISPRFHLPYVWEGPVFSALAWMSLVVVIWPITQLAMAGIAQHVSAVPNRAWTVPAVGAERPVGESVAHTDRETAPRRKAESGRRLDRRQLRGCEKGGLAVERLFAWLHWFRRLVVRYEFHAENFLGMVRLGCMKIVLRYL
jgi:hypothetical protein